MGVWEKSKEHREKKKAPRPKTKLFLTYQNKSYVLSHMAKRSDALCLGLFSHCLI
jgi:hypothetical protein